MHKNIADIRQDYRLHSLNEGEVAADAIEQFTRWWNDAINSEISEVNAMTLATSTKDGKPSARIVLLKGYDEKGFVFYTNYESQKGIELAQNPHAALVFFWKEIERQVRIEGMVEKNSAAESDAYFFSRPEGSRIGAWASPQSQAIENREWLDKEDLKYREIFRAQPIIRPDHWGGYRVQPQRIEFWQGRPSRLHDRLYYTLDQQGHWSLQRLAP